MICAFTPLRDSNSDAPHPRDLVGGSALGCESRISASPMLVQGERVDHERVADEVHKLARVAYGVRTSEPHGVLEIPVD